MNLSRWIVAALCASCMDIAQASSQETEVLKPVHRFLDALARRDKDGLLAETAPNIEIISWRKGELRRLTIDKLGDALIGYRAGDIAEPIFHPSVRIDDNLAMVWAPYKFLFNGKADHCGTDVITLMKLHDRWVITGLADNAREDCK